jgi:hypothetical protein
MYAPDAQLWPTSDSLFNGARPIAIDWREPSVAPSVRDHEADSRRGSAVADSIVTDLPVVCNLSGNAPALILPFDG